MNQPFRDRLVQAIANVVPETEETFCDQTQALLDVYVEAELAGEPIAQLYPAITNHLRVCPDCHEEYVSLRELLATFDSTALPNVHWNPTLFLVPVAPPTDPQTTWARTRLTDWINAFGTLRLVTTRSAPAPHTSFPPRPAAGRTHQKNVPLLGPQVVLELAPEQHDGRGTLRVRFVPFTPALREQTRGSVARLYRVMRTPEPQVSFVAERPVQALGMTFEDVTIQDYVLTITLTDEEVAVVWIEAEVWKP